MRFRRFCDHHFTILCQAKTDFPIFLLPAVDPVLIKQSNTGIDIPVVIKGEREELKCTTKRSYPPANFSWRYQQLDCKDHSTCTRYSSRLWKPISKRIGEVQRNSPTTSVLVVPANIDKMYFKCTAVNSVGRDSKVYRFLRRGK